MPTDVSVKNMNKTVAIITCLVEEKAKARGLTDEDLDRLATKDGDCLLEKIADLLASEARSATRTAFPVTVDYHWSLDAMIKAGRYGWVNLDITAEHFPVKPGPAEVSIELVHFDRVMSSDDVLAEFDRRGLRPATLPELLSFGAKYPEKQREFPIVALASVWRFWYGFRGVPFLWGLAGGRDLSLIWLDDWWIAHFRFAAVRK
ncbi:MAG: hypothetical protein HY294_06580 [Candidatus Rokubacteria bacterium]|nr:hypothetical protein [Candidatus Rokubacteria bacterium]